MSLQHFFISYSTADAQDFAIKLHDELESGHPKLEAWLDKRDLQPGDDWDTQIDDGIRDCGALLFVMTPDSVMDNSVCKLEWSRALSYKKTVIPIFYKQSMLPFRLGNRQYIDFTDFSAGIAELRKYLARVNSPAGELKRMKDELLDMQRRLNRAPESEEARIKVAMKDLEERIATQQFLVDNPEEAAKKTEKSIEAAIQRERQPADKPKSGTKFINHPPATVPSYFQDRVDETNILANFLQDDRHRIFHLIGRAGIGKTAVTVRLLKHLEGGKLPDDNGEMTVDGIVYLSQVGSRDLKVAHLYPDLCRLLPDDTAKELDALYREPKTSTADKMKALLSHFPPDKRVLVLLDNFEDVVDGETQAIRDEELDEALKALVDVPPHGVKVLITTRVRADKLYLHQTQRQRQHVLGQGLASPYAEEMLKEMDSDGSLGLKDADMATLGKIADKVMRYPRALEALVGWLEVDISTTLDDVLAFSEGLLPENVVEVLVKQAINRLDKTSLQVIQALAIFGRPVSANAIDTLLRHYNPGIDSSIALRRLLNWHFTRRESGMFTLHPVDREYALGLIPRGEDSDRFERGTPNFTQIALYALGADYFKTLRTPREEWKTIADLDPQLAEFDLRCNAGDWDTAADVLLDLEGETLFLWGYYKLIIDLREKLIGNLLNKKHIAVNLGHIGITHYSIGNLRTAIQYLEDALSIDRISNRRYGESAWLGNLGLAYSALGDFEKAMQFFQDALKISREIGDRKLEGQDLGNLGTAYRNSGNIEKALEYYHEALSISREIGDKFNEATWLSSIGNAYLGLMDITKSIEYRQLGLEISQAIGNRRGVGNDIGNLGIAYHYLGEIEKALEYYHEALLVSQEIGDKFNEALWLSSIGNIHSERGETPKAMELHLQALSVHRGTGNRRLEAFQLWYLGDIAIDIGDLEAAENYFRETMFIADEVDFDRLSHGSRRDLALIRLYQSKLMDAKSMIDEALLYEMFKKKHYSYNLLGTIMIRLKNIIQARVAFDIALSVSNELLEKTPDYFDVKDAKGLALCGLALLDNDPAKVTEARTVFYEARAKTKELKGHIRDIQRRFDELAKADSNNLLTGVREAIAGE